MTARTTLTIAALFGLLAVGLGAFGAHALKPMLLATARLDTFQTAVAYHFYHSLALLATGIWINSSSSKKLSYASVCFVAGIFLFSGSLYVICLTGISAVGIVTPFGGVLFLGGWMFLFLTALSMEQKK